MKRMGAGVGGVGGVGGAALIDGRSPVTLREGSGRRVAASGGEGRGGTLAVVSSSPAEGMGSELNLDTEFPHFTDGRERLCMEVRKRRGGGEGEKREREGVSSPPARPPAARRLPPLPKRGRFHTAAAVCAKAGPPLIHSPRGEGPEPRRRLAAISLHKAINGALYKRASETLLIC
ncbi:hypothetical protein EYF80_025186 [Liparis tanakae]|uniref:Uncharacterized protein n=1 Tax=Liparis tanakae TaxID=230148 RepID=A0A4Z2HFD4_9TELE|nr:hypothetical protein EYF80_025186 [Liparis tanakae]